MKYEELSNEIIEAVGGKQNIVDVSALAHPIIDTIISKHFPNPVPIRIGIIGAITPIIVEIKEFMIFFFSLFSLSFFSSFSSIFAILQISR